MTEDSLEARGITRHANAEATSAAGWVTTEVAAKALRVAPRTVRAYLEQRRLKGKAEGKGVRKTWLVSIDSVQALRAERLDTAGMPHDVPTNTPEDVAASLADTLRGMTYRLESRAAEAEGLRVRLELTEKTESTLREELEKAQEEVRSLREELQAERARGFWRRLFGG